MAFVGPAAEKSTFQLTENLKTFFFVSTKPAAGEVSADSGGRSSSNQKLTSDELCPGKGDKTLHHRTRKYLRNPGPKRNMYTGAGETGGVYADEVQAQDGQMKSIRKKDTIGQVTSRSRTHAGAMPNEGVQKGGGQGVRGGWKRGPDILTRSEATGEGNSRWFDLILS